MKQEVVTSHIENGVGWITLNRPQVLNSINIEMIQIIDQVLEEWLENDDVSIVCLTGEGEKGFCAGGDMRSLYDLKDVNVEEVAKQFFSTEYRLDLKIHHYPKPILAYLHGVVMGGGIGLTIGANYRIVTEKTKWAMPEMNIGFFPDVGASYFLNQMPGCIGRYLALTAAIIKAEDVLYVGAADFYIDSEKWQELQHAITEQNWSQKSAHDQLSHLLNRYCTSTKEGSILAETQDKIDKHFSFESVEEIVNSLQNAADEGDEWAVKTVASLLKASPLSLKVTLRQLQEGKKLSLEECYAMEEEIALTFMKSHDFYEGVRAVLVDKDRSPKWQPSTLAEISEEEVSRFF